MKKTCSIEGCTTPVCARGWCSAHYQRWRMHGDPLAGGALRQRQGDSCSVDGCTAPCHAYGMCGMHSARWRRHGDPTVLLVQPRGPVCIVAGCSKAVHARGWCPMHYSRWLTHGDPNEVHAGGRKRQAAVGYGHAHVRVTNTRGRASEHECVDCGAQATHWSYDHADPDELTGTVGKTVMTYSLDVGHYEPRCIPCHKGFDSVRMAEQYLQRKAAS